MTPAALSFPSFFREFRPAQQEAVEHVLESSARFIALGLPTGVGKSGIALALAQLLPGRTTILTGTLGLQDQYSSTFGSMGLMDMRGRANYSCWEGGSCEDGSRMDCKDKEGCPYVCALKGWNAADAGETSYAWWLAAPKVAQTDTLICDEAGLAGEWLSRALDFVLSLDELEKAAGTGKWPYMPREQHDEWAALAPGLHMLAEGNYNKLRAQRQSTFNPVKRERIARDLKHAESLLDRVSRLSQLDDNWTITQEDDPKYGRRWKFECVWPGRYREKLFRFVLRVVLMSATMRPKTLSLLGIAKADYDFREWGRQFPAANGPVLWIPTADMSARRLTEEGEKRWLDRIFEIIDKYPDRNGLIHTVSYARARTIVDEAKRRGTCVRNNRQRLLFNANEPGSPRAAAVFDDFRHAQPGSVLVSPSFSTGWDFAGTLAEYQIIAKVPFPDMRSKVMSARREQDRTYGNYEAAQALVQACGRIVRSDQDRGTTYIIDDQIGWFVRGAAEHLPKWFKVRREEEIPKLLEKL